MNGRYRLPALCYRLLLLVLLPLLIAGCGVAVGALTPEEATRRGVLGDRQVRGPVVIVSTRPWAGGVAVLYRADFANDGRAPLSMFGYELVERRATGWWSRGGGGGNSQAGQPPPPRVTVGVGGGGGVDSLDFTIVYGEVLAPEVAAVEARVADGQTLRDDTADDVYAIVMPGRRVPCELRLLDSANGELERIPLAPLSHTPEACGR